MISDAREDFRDHLVGQIRRDARDNPGNRFLDQIGLKVLDHLLRCRVGDIERSLTDGMTDATHCGVECGVGRSPRTSGSAAHQAPQPVI
jgi:hypothetical protein